MKRLTDLQGSGRKLAWSVALAVGLGALMFYKLGSLTGGLSSGEMSAATTPVGWHGVYHQPLYLPLKIVRSVIFVLFTHHGQTLSRLPNVLFGGLAIFSFVYLIKLWHSARTAVLTGLLFATSAWVLHVSRLASFDVLYLCAVPLLLLINLLLQKQSQHLLVWYGSLLAWGLALYIPGLVWFVGVGMYLQRVALRDAWSHFKLAWQRLTYLLIGLIWLPLLIIDLWRPGQLMTWLGFPSHLAALEHIPKQLVGVPVHLFIRGPQYPDLWLGRAPILDIFTLAACLIGLYFYVIHHRASRSHLLGLYGLIGLILVSLGGPVSLSLLVPLLYIGVAAGIAYLLHEWMHTFPYNPLARGLGLGLLLLAISLSSVYNLKAYFVAWPHAEATKAVFKYHR